ncbi:hypothetical protein Mapa_011436 [Marchantia paleacea]|nr:hypothetical protein Mapa_011436 [Marchantia paleacea]
MGELLVRRSRPPARKPGGGRGSKSTAQIPPSRADAEPNKKAGKFPPPKNSSQGPAPTETITCVCSQRKLRQKQRSNI